MAYCQVPGRRFVRFFPGYLITTLRPRARWGGGDEGGGDVEVGGGGGGGGRGVGRRREGAAKKEKRKQSLWDVKGTAKKHSANQGHLKTN